MRNSLPSKPFVRVRAVKPLDGHNVQVTFTNGTVRNINLEKYLHGPAFEPIRKDPEMFRRVFIGDGRTLAWPTGADIDPDVLYYDLTPAWMERAPEHTP
ncbi:MAG: DUF2442 domain-containing protein [Chloroflexi bacterium]|nr:DUF2442 domain-containing protein [Chloroflexota bacterium]